MSSGARLIQKEREFIKYDKKNFSINGACFRKAFKYYYLLPMIAVVLYVPRTVTTPFWSEVNAFLDAYFFGTLLPSVSPHFAFSAKVLTLINPVVLLFYFAMVSRMMLKANPAWVRESYAIRKKMLPKLREGLFAPILYFLMFSCAIFICLMFYGLDDSVYQRWFPSLTVYRAVRQLMHGNLFAYFVGFAIYNCLLVVTSYSMNIYVLRFLMFIRGKE